MQDKVTKIYVYRQNQCSGLRIIKSGQLKYTKANKNDDMFLIRVNAQTI